MASEIDVPGTGESVDPTDPAEAGTTVVKLVAGFALLFTFIAFGQQGAGFIQNTVSNVTGMNVGDGQPDVLPTA